MTSTRLLRLFAAVSIAAALFALWSWYQSGEMPDRWLIRLSAGAFVVALLTGLIGAETRPRIMLRFLAALFGLFAVLAFASDYARPLHEGQSHSAMTLLEDMQNFAPAFAAGLERWVTNSFGAAMWDPVLSTLIGTLPAYLLFLLLAMLCGYAGRPRHSIRIFVNER